METTPIELELRKLGFTEKEAKVYLAGLELGPSSVQRIAKKAGLTRPTTYEVVRSLEEKGLFAETKQKKKRFFLAQSPGMILGMLRTKKREIEEKEREFIRIIAALESKYAKGKREIRNYKGKKGLKVLEEKLSLTNYPNIFVLSSRTNQREIKKREKIYQKIKKRLGKIKVKEIYPKKIKSMPTFPWLERKFLPSLDLAGTLILFDKVILFYSLKEGLLIEDKLIVNIFKSLFLTLWSFKK